DGASETTRRGGLATRTSRPRESVNTRGHASPAAATFSAKTPRRSPRNRDMPAEVTFTTDAHVSVRGQHPLSAAAGKKGFAISCRHFPGNGSYLPFHLMIRALVFDFDGLILDTETPLIDAFADVHAAHEKPFQRESFIRSVGEADFSFDPWKAFGRDADRAELEAEMQFYKRIRILAQPILPGVVSMM